MYPLSLLLSLFRQIESVLVAGHCLDTMERRDYNPPVELNICDEGDGNQAFMLTKANEFKVTRYCLDATSRGSLATFYECHGEKGNQYWEYDSSVSAASALNFDNMFIS